MLRISPLILLAPDGGNGGGAGAGAAAVGTQAGTQTGAAQAGAGSASQQAGAGTSQAGAGSAAQGAEATARVPIDDTPLYQGNFKRILANELDLDQQLRQIIVDSAQRRARNAEDFDGQIRSLALNALTLAQTSLQNAVVLSNRQNNQALSDDVRANDNAESHDTAMESVNQSERERTVRGGDVVDVLRAFGLSHDLFFENAVEAAVARAFARERASASAAK